MRDGLAFERAEVEQADHSPVGETKRCLMLKEEGRDFEGSVSGHGLPPSDRKGAPYRGLRESCSGHESSILSAIIGTL